VFSATAATALIPPLVYHYLSRTEKLFTYSVITIHACMLKARIVKLAEIAVARERL
jgi:hypothetical protein